MPRPLATTAAPTTFATLAFTVHAYLAGDFVPFAMGNYMPFMLGITAMMVRPGAWSLATSDRD